MKLYEKQYGCQPQASPKQVASGSAPGAPSNLLSAKPKEDDDFSDDYEDDWGNDDDSKKDKKAEDSKKAEKDK